MNARCLAMVALLVACGGHEKSATTTDPDPQLGGGALAGVVQDTRSPIEKRRDVACAALGPRVTKCAVDDARAELAAGRMTKPDFEANTARAIQDKNTEEFVAKCEVQLSSRQVRVLEVCRQDETECAPLLDCLGHINDKPTARR